MSLLVEKRSVSPTKALCKFIGESEETKPTASWISEFSTFKEYDTGKTKYYTGQSWGEIPQTGGGGGAADLEFAEGNDF